MFSSFPFVEKVTVCTFLTEKRSVKRQPLPNFTIKTIAVKEPLYGQTASMIFPNVRNLEEVIVDENIAQANLFDYFEQSKIKFARLTYNGEFNGRIPFNIIFSKTCYFEQLRSGIISNVLESTRATLSPLQLEADISRGRNE